jgi:hypothetical protein
MIQQKMRVESPEESGRVVSINRRVSRRQGVNKQQSVGSRRVSARRQEESLVGKSTNNQSAAEESLIRKSLEESCLSFASRHW